MSRTTKRFLSILLAAAMILSLGITGWAIDDDITIVDPTTAPAARTDEHVTAGFEGGTDLELEEIDPSKLNVPKLGETEEEGVMTSEDLPFGLNDIVRVSIVLDAPATMAAGYATQNIADNRGAMAYRETLKQQQAGVEAAIASAGVTMNVKWNLTLAVNIISAEVRYGDIETIEAVPGVKEVWLENKYEPQVDEINTANTTEHMVGATAVWASGYTGAGTRIAIIDTGTDQDHQSFDPEALEYALAEDGGDYNLLTWDEISAVAGKLNAPVTEEVYKNTKIPYAYNYIDHNYNTDHMSDTAEEHGSHVSGIAAANRYVKVDGEFVDAASNVFAVGVAPDAQILTMKVFGAGGGAYDSDYMSAIEDAIILKADSVNLSLGSSSPGFTFSNDYQKVMDSLIECGTVVSISMGNSYNWASFIPAQYKYLYLEDVGLHTGGSPGSFINSLTVAAAENTGTVGTPLLFNGNQQVTYTETFESDGVAYGNVPISSIAGTYDYVLVDGPGVDDNDHVGQEGDAFLAIGRDVLEGKIALCYRGSSSFFAKANAAAAQGAAGVIIINNADGIIRMNLTGYEYTVPAVSILKADGDTIMANSTAVRDDYGKVLYYTGSMEVTDKTVALVTTERKDATITEFSSWGVPGSLIMKPEITAPGGDIYSVFGSNRRASGVFGGPDQYEFMSGTSMAAPHITGMAALLGQYIRENNLEEVTGQNARTLINSLLMSTATPMIVDGNYLSILQQGSGLGDTFAATQALSYILMDEDANSGAADGKVKVELGADKDREGTYSFGFTVNNFTEKDTLVYELYTDLFTQSPAFDGEHFLLNTTTLALAEGEDYTVSYDFPRRPLSGHDVNLDGGTDRDDVQALLDYLTGLVDGETLDLEAGEMDGTEGISSYDAQLLLQWLVDNGIDQLVVPAGESVPVTVTITYTEDTKAFLNYYYTNGAYVEGFTYVTPHTLTDDGAMLDVEHSIPILGFYGNWTDASMFDCVTAIDTLYGNTKTSYTGNAVTNYLTVNYGKGASIYTGNPYTVENAFPADRLAINSDTKLVNFKYNLIRNAGTAGWLAIDANGEILKNGGLASQIGAYYYVNGGEWRNIATQTAAINTTPLALGLRENDVFTIGYFAVPEYYGMMLHPGENINTVTADEISQLLESGDLGAGAGIDYTFTVDNTVPEAEAKLSDDGTKITVTAKDNNYVAYVAIMDVSGNVVYAGQAPEQTKKGEEVEVTFDISELNLPNGVAIFVGDYAANEKAYLIIFDPDKPVTATKVVYMLTDTLAPDNDYVIANVNAGAGYAMGSQGTQAYVAPVGINVVTDENGTYIPFEDVSDALLWHGQTVTESGVEGVGFTNVGDGGGLSYNAMNGPYVNWDGARYVDCFLYQDGRLLYGPYASYGYGMKFYNSNFCFGSGATPIYLYTKTTLEIELDPTSASSVTVTPEAATLILDVLPTLQLTATVEPIVVPDRTVTWTSSDETVATVDAEGLVTAVGIGTAIITASSNQTPDVTASATINVTAGEPMDGYVYGQVAFAADDIEYAAIDLSTMGVTDLSDNAMFSAFYGGGVSGEYVYGNDIDNDFHRYKLTDDFAYDSDYHFQIVAQYAMWDGACFPAFSIADYAGVDATDETAEPAITNYPYILTGFNSSNKLMYMDEEGGLRYFDLSDLGNFVAITFIGAEQDEETGLPNFYYLLLADDGMLYFWDVYPKVSTGGFSAEYNEVAHVNVLTVGEDHSAYSMSYFETEDGGYGVLVADSSIGGIYWVNLAEAVDGEVDAHFVGKIDGATSLTTLSDLYYDMTVISEPIEINKPDEGGDEGGSLTGRELPAALRDLPMSGVVLESQDAVIFEPANSDDVVLDTPDADDDIVIVGGLNAASNAVRKPSVQLDSAVWGNPDTYETEGVYVMLTTPNFDQEIGHPEGVLDVSTVFSAAQPNAKSEYEDVYNGLMTVTYDPEVLTYDSFVSHYGIEMKSFSVDEENGIIKFAFVTTKAIPEGVVGVLHFTTPVEDTEIKVVMDEFNDDLTIAETTIIEIKGLGYHITIEDYTKGGATTSIDEEALYRDEVEFTVNADQAVLVAVKNGDNDYTRLFVQGSGDDGYTFKITVKADTTIALAYKGDANLNGVVETKDGTMIKRAAVESYTFTNELAKLAADVNGNGKIESKDGTMVSKVVVGTYEIAW